MNAILALQSESSLIATTRFHLVIGTFILGRSSKCDLVVKHETISRCHAEIVLTRRETTVRDLGSRNGTFIDNKPVLTGEMQAGQNVRFGSIAFLLKSIQTGNDDPDSEEETARCARADPSVGVSHPPLSRAQSRVLDLILQGLGEKKVAAQLNLSATTIHNHIQAIYRAFNVHSRSELLVRLLANNGIPHATGM